MLDLASKELFCGKYVGIARQLLSDLKVGFFHSLRINVDTKSKDSIKCNQQSNGSKRIDKAVRLNAREQNRPSQQATQRPDSKYSNPPRSLYTRRDLHSLLVTWTTKQTIAAKTH